MPGKRQRTTTESGTHTSVAKKSKPATVVVASNKPPTVRAIAEKALAIAKTMSKSMENKTQDFTSNTTVGTTAGSLHFTAVSQGTGQSQRIGNSLYLTGMALNFYWYKHPSSIVTNIRFVVFMDTQTVSDQTSLNWTDVFDNVSNLAMINRGSQRNRFKILYDQSAILDASEISGRHTKIYFPINKTIEYNGSANTDIQKNGVYGLVLSDDNTNQPAFNYYSRIYFRDS